MPELAINLDRGISGYLVSSFELSQNLDEGPWNCGEAKEQDFVLAV